MAEFIEILSPKALADIKEANSEVLKLVSGIDKAGEAMKNIKTPSGSDSAVKALNDKLIRQEKLYADLQIKLQKYAQAQAQTQIKNNQLEQSTIRLNKAKEQTIKQLEREEAKLKASQTLYNKTQAQLNLVNKAYNDLATKKARYNNLTENEEKRLVTLQKTTEKYNNTLKAVDFNIGKYGRNVANYANTGFNPLQNSINQLTRELPNAGQSFQIFVMSIGNNIGALQDAVSGIIAQNKILKAEGKATTSVLSQIGSTLLSWNTALYLGIAVFLAYSDEISKWTESLIKGARALDTVKESQKSINESTKEGAKNAVEETLKLKSLLEIAKDTSLSYKERKIAVDELQSTYPAYFGNLTQEQILAGQTTEAENALTEAILSRAKANAAVAKITENQAKVIDLNEQEYNLKVKLRNVTAETKTLEELQRNGKLKNANALLINYRKEKDLANEIKEVQKEANHYDEINNRLTNYAIENQKKAILLDDKESKGKEKKIEQLKETEKYQTNSQKAFEANISALENELSTIDRMNPEYDTLNGLLQLQKTIYDQLFKSKEKNSEQDVIDLENLGKLAKGMLDFALYGKKATEQLDLFGKAGEGAMAGFEKSQKSIDDYLKTFQSEFFSNAGLPTLFKILNDEIVGFGTNWAVTFTAMAEVAQEAFKYIEQAQNRRYENQIKNLQNEYTLARKFAGDNADAQAEIDRQYEAKLREIRIREFKAKKRLAIVEANINIAQGVIASLAKGGTAGIVMAGIIGALGIVQLATIQNQEMPEYWTGTENAQSGLALTQERGREFIFDRSGKLKSTGSDKGATVTKMDGGETVWDAGKTRQALDAMMFNDQLNNILSSNGISSPMVNNRLNDERIVDALNSVEFAINNKSYEGVKLDENGIKKYISNGQTTTYLTNARRTFTPRNT